MKLIIRFIVLTVSFFYLFIACSEEPYDENGKGILTGKVVQAETYIPVANAKISTNPNTSSVFTDSLGNFVIENIPIGDYSIEARKEGFVTRFEAATIKINETTNIVFELDPEEEINNSPEIPELIAPEDNEENIDLSVDLIWSCLDPEDDIITYKITLRNDITNEIEVFENINDTIFTLENLNYSTKYFWQVTANDGINNDVNSETQSFRTLEFPNARFLYTKKISDNNVIFTADENGNELQLTSSATNSFRPRKNLQANKISFIRTTGGQAHLYTMNPDGSNVFKVTQNIPLTGFNLDFYNYSWKSNGSQFLYSNFDKLYSINTDGSGLELIFQTPNGKFISECDWSYDSSQIAIKVNDPNGYNVEIYIINMAGNIIYNVLNGVGGAVNGLHLSVDNSKLVFTQDITQYESSDYRQLDNRIFLHDFSSSITTEIDVAKPNGYNDYDVRFSPNEASVIFVSTSNDNISERVVYSCEIANSNTRTILFQNSIMPEWK
ncbi:MAG: carboxypeptidase regulatory-like domain-containing protein [Flavobacterium sp.]|nr:carboxypeptidase regulatory-like domain-containing protein [Flavobacterium sp.]